MITAQLLLSVDYMNRNQIVHRDLKPENILLAKKFQEGRSCNEKDDHLDVKMADFGYAIKLHGSQDGDKSPKFRIFGTPCYIAPEVLKHQGYSAKSDVFSVGSILFNMLTHKHLFPGVTNSEVIDENKHGDVSHVPYYISIIPQ